MSRFSGFKSLWTTPLDEQACRALRSWNENSLIKSQLSPFGLSSKTSKRLRSTYSKTKKSQPCLMVRRSLLSKGFMKLDHVWMINTPEDL